MLPGYQLRQVAPFLFLAAVAVDLVHAEVGMRAVRQADRGGGATDFLNGDDMFGIAHARAAEFLCHRDAMQSQRAKLRPQIGGKFVSLVYFGGARRDLIGGEGAHHIAQHVGAFAEVEIQSWQCIGNHRRSFTSAGTIMRRFRQVCATFCGTRITLLCGTSRHDNINATKAQPHRNGPSRHQRRHLKDR
jgi:hypothetical protein